MYLHQLILIGILASGVKNAYFSFAIALTLCLFFIIFPEHLPAYFHPHDPNNKHLLLEERLSPFVKKLNKRGHITNLVTDWSEGFILCARKKDKIYDAYADIRSYKSQIFQAQGISW